MSDPEAMDAAVARFKSISTSLGGHEQAQAFFATYGTDGFKPEAETWRNLYVSTGFKPDYEVFGASAISIKETDQSEERSMAQNGFSSEAISASVSVSTPFVGGSVSASYATEQARSKSSADLADRKEFTATYNFPRARVFLDDLNLEVTTECAKYLVNIQNAANKIKENIDRGAKPDDDSAVTNAGHLVNQFYTRFGHIFACTVQLGGQLTSTKSASSFASTQDEQKKDAMQAAVAASVESKYVSVSASYSKGQTDESSEHKAKTDSSSALAWNARGGNSLLCANPAAWANSVAHHSTWRVMEQEDVIALPELISKLVRPTDDATAAWPEIDKTFLTIAQNKFNEIPAVPPGTWTGKLSFMTLDGKKVVIKDGCISVSTEGEATVSNVLDADLKRRNKAVPKMVQLYADHPLFLLPSHRPIARQSQADGAQVPSLWVDPRAEETRIWPDANGVQRWSLRPAAVLPAKNAAICSAPWNPDKIVLRDGDEVGLFNHSYFAGGTYTTTEKPPFFAPYAVKRPDEDAIRVWKMGPTWMDTLTTDEMRNNPNWEFIKHDHPLQPLMELSDQGRASDAHEAQIDIYGRLFGLKDISQWTKDHDLLLNKYASTTGQYQVEGITREWFAGKLEPFCKYGLDIWGEKSGFQETVQVQSDSMVSVTRRQTKVEPLRLRVKFVS